MPELPEAEANRARIEEGALHRTITSISIHETTHMDMPSPDARRRLEGTQLTKTHRHGKYIFAGSATGPWLAVHLGMSGSLRTYDGDDNRPDYAKLIVRFEGDRRLAFRCPRKLGWVKIVEDPEGYIEEKGLGPDAMQIGDNAFAETIGKTKGALKSALMSQKKLAGIGNLWSDEILYRQGVGPEARGCDRSAGQLSDLHAEMRHVLQSVLDTGTTYSELPDDWLIHHRDEGAECPRCGGTITRKKVGGRSAYHCAKHQS